jgi:hypothetical protein
VGDAKVEVDVLPRQAEHLRDSPALQEQQRNRSPKPMLSDRHEQGPRLVPIERHATRVGDPKRLHRPHGVPHERAHLHRLVDHLGQRLSMMAHRPGRQRASQLGLPLRDDPVVELDHRQLAQGGLDLADAILRLGPRRGPHRMAMHVVQPPVRQPPDRAQPTQLEASLLLPLRPPLDGFLLRLARRLAGPFLPRHPPGRAPAPVRLPVDRPLLVRGLAEHRSLTN